MAKMQFERLNQEAKQYLQSVREVRGKGAPGYYISLSNNAPLWGFLIGIVILVFTFLFTFAVKPAKGPMAMAMLGTAGFLLGGWLVLFALRRWGASKDKYAGKFLYFDPDFVYVGHGEEISIYEVGEMPEVEPQGQGVFFRTENGSFMVPVPGVAVSQLIAAYYQALRWVQQQTEGRWADLSPPEAGAVARYLVEHDEEPTSLKDTDLTIDTMPHEVFAEKSGSSGVLMLLAIPAVGVALFFGLWSLFTPLNDLRAFENAKDEGAQGLRDYLMNEKNTDHIDEAKELLAKLYDQPINTINAQATDDVLKKGMIELLNTLRGPEVPAISIRVRSQADKLPDDTGPESSLRTRFADGIGNAIGGSKKDLIVCVKAPDDKNAHIEVLYQQVPGNLVNWTVAIRLTPDSDPIATKSGTATIPPQPLIPVPAPNNLNFAPKPGNDAEAVYQDVMKRMIGQTPALPTQPIEDF